MPQALFSMHFLYAGGLHVFWYYPFTIESSGTHPLISYLQLNSKLKSKVRPFWAGCLHSVQVLASLWESLEVDIGCWSIHHYQFWLYQPEGKGFDPQERAAKEISFYLCHLQKDEQGGGFLQQKVKAPPARWGQGEQSLQCQDPKAPGPELQTWDKGWGAAVLPSRRRGEPRGSLKAWRGDMLRSQQRQPNAQIWAAVMGDITAPSSDSKKHVSSLTFYGKLKQHSIMLCATKLIFLCR